MVNVVKVLLTLSIGLIVTASRAQNGTAQPVQEKPVPVANSTASPPPAPPPLPAANEPITLTDGVRFVRRTRKELGLAPIPDPAALKAALTRIAPQFAQASVNARPYAYRGMLKIDPGSYSRALNAPATAERILSTLKAKPGANQFSVALDKKPPVLTPERLKGINGVLSSVTTTAWVDEGRNKNIRLGVGRIDGIFLSPGEVFSLNQVVGPRSQNSGFKEAPIFVNAEKVDGLGGGISQVTGTVFNAAARAGLHIIEANLHSQPVKYLPLGQDATVAWGDKDMRFKNDTGAPVYIAMSFAKQKLNVTLFGKTTPGQKVILKPVVQRLGVGKINADLYRTIKINGQVVRKERLVQHQYRWDPQASQH